MAAAMNLSDLCAGKRSRFGFDNAKPGHSIPVEITIVDERDGYYHLIGSPLALADEEYAAKAWVRFADIPALQLSHFRFLHGSVKSVDLERKTARYTPHGTTVTEALEYDYLVAATGLRRDWPSVPQARTREEYLEEARPHIEKVGRAEHGVAVIGGGAVGIEMAAELKMVHPHVNVTLIHSRDRLLSSEPLPDDFKDQTLDLLREAGVETLMGNRVLDISSGPADGSKTLHLSDNTTLTAREVLNAVSSPKPTTSYLPPSSLNAVGEVPVNADLTFASPGLPNSTHHYAIGDLTPQPGIKRCGAAMHHGSYAAYNIHQSLLHSRGLIDRAEMKMVVECGPNIGLAVGRQAIAYSEQTRVMRGEETLGYLFGEDLGFGYCWDYLGLGERVDEGDAGLAEGKEMVEKKDEVVVVVEEKGAAVVVKA